MCQGHQGMDPKDKTLNPLKGKEECVRGTQGLTLKEEGKIKENLLKNPSESHM